MSGRTSLPRTRFARVACSDPGVTVIRISGSLGPRAKPQLVRLTQECLRRNLPRLVLDLSEVEALGGGTARLLNEFAAARAGRGGKTAFRVASRTVRGFLCADPNLPPPALAASLDEAVAAVRGSNGSPATEPQTARAAAVPPGRAAGGERRPPAALDPRPRAPARRTSSGVWANASESDDSDPVLDLGLDLEAVVEEEEDVRRPAPGARPEELRERLATALYERGIASRVFVFQRHPDGRLYLVTRQGNDVERAFDGEGAVVTGIAARRGPTFLVDLDDEGLTDHEMTLLGELNCEVVAALGRSARPEYIVFLSKERPGDEYTLEELQALETVLGDTTQRLLGLETPSVLQAEAEPALAEIPTLRAEPVDHDDLDAFLDDPVIGLSPRSGYEMPRPPAARPEFVVAESDRQMPIEVVDREPNSARRTALPDATRALRRSVAQMRDILSLSQDFDAAFGTSRLLEVLVLSVVSVARVETVLYFAARDGDYRLTHQRGMSSDSIQGLRLRGDATLVQRALASARGVCIGDDAQITEEERIWARQHGLHHAVPFRYKDDILGLLMLGECAESTGPDLDMLSHLLAQAGLAYDRARLYETLQDRTLGVVRGLITLIEARNGFDCGSTEQVVRYTQGLARELQFPAESTRDLVYGAVLRDVGMLQVSESLLRSAADLTGDQWEAIRRHPQEGASIMRQMRFSPLAVDVVLHHHEAYNGEGYPMGLRGRAIPLGARIVSVAESFVKMTMDRPYRKALGKAEALESLAENWGLRYDPLVVDALVRVVNRELSMGLAGDRDLARDLFGV